MHQIFPRCDLQEQPTSPRTDGTPRHWPDALADGGPAALIIDSAGKLLYANPAYRALARPINSNLSGEIGEAAIIPHELLLRVLDGEGPLEDAQQHRNAQGITATRGRY